MDSKTFKKFDRKLIKVDPAAMNFADYVAGRMWTDVVAQGRAAGLSLEQADQVAIDICRSAMQHMGLAVKTARVQRALGQS